MTSNFMVSSRPEDVEALSGSSVLNGIPVRIEPASTVPAEVSLGAEPVTAG